MGVLELKNILFLIGVNSFERKTCKSVRNLCSTFSEITDKLVTIRNIYSNKSTEIGNLVLTTNKSGLRRCFR